MYSLCAPHPPTRRPAGRRSRRPGQRVPVDSVPLCKALHAGQVGSRLPLHRRGMGACRSAAINGTARRPAARPPPPSCPMCRGVLAYHRRDNVPGQIRAQIGPLDHPPRSPRGQGPATQEPTMQPNTVNTHHDTDPPPLAAVPPELLEAVARALAAALIPPPRTASATGNGAGRGLPDRRAARPAAGGLPGDGPAAGDRRGAAAHRGVPRRPQDHPPLPAAVR